VAASAGRRGDRQAPAVYIWPRQRRGRWWGLADRDTPTRVRVARPRRRRVSSQDPMTALTGAVCDQGQVRRVRKTGAVRSQVEPPFGGGSIRTPMAGGGGAVGSGVEVVVEPKLWRWGGRWRVHAQAGNEWVYAARWSRDRTGHVLHVVPSGSSAEKTMYWRAAGTGRAVMQATYTLTAGAISRGG